MAYRILDAATGSGSGSGSGFSLGPVQNEFADDAARDTYATANAGWVTQYNDNRAFWIRVGGAAGTIQRRNVAGTGWENVTGIVSGRDGAAGAAGVDGSTGAAGLDGAAGGGAIEEVGSITESGSRPAGQLVATGVTPDSSTEFMTYSLNGELLLWFRLAGMRVTPVTPSVGDTAVTSGTTQNANTLPESAGGSISGSVAGGIDADGQLLIATKNANVDISCRFYEYRPGGEGGGSGGLTESEVDARADLRAAARYTDTEKSKVAGVAAGANRVTPYKIGNIYRATASGVVPTKPGNTEGTVAISGITVAPVGWRLTRPEATEALPNVYDCHVYGYDINSVFGWQFGTPNRTDRYNPFVADAYAAIAGATFTGETGGVTPVNDTNFTTKAYVDAVVAGTTPPSPQAEKIYYGAVDAADAAAAAAVAVAGLTTEDAAVAGHSITLGPSTDGQFFVIFVPADHDLLTLVNTGTQANELSAYTRTTRTIESVAYVAYVLGPLNDGVSITYRLTLTE